MKYFAHALGWDRVSRAHLVLWLLGMVCMLLMIAADIYGLSWGRWFPLWLVVLIPTNPIYSAKRD